MRRHLTSVAVARRCSRGRRPRSALPGFGLTMGYTLLYLEPRRADSSVGARSCKTAALSWEQFWADGDRTACGGVVHG